MAVLAISTKLWFFSFNPYFELVELDPVWFGWIFALLNVVAYLSSKYAAAIRDKMGERNLILAMGLFASLPILLMGAIVAKISIAFILFDSFVRGIKEPFFSSFINKHLDSENRATVLSIKSSALALISGIALWIFSLSLGAGSLPLSLMWLSLALLVLVIYGVFRYHKIFGH
jgi:hypothetical protein